jgi:tRNA(adenine34) deaminase
MAANPAIDVSLSEIAHLRRAIALGEKALASGNRPFGAVVVASDGRVLAEAENTTVTENDIASHAEINAIRTVCGTGSQDRLIGATAFTNFPPCPMCAGAMMRFGFAKIVYGARWETMVRGVPQHSSAFSVDLEKMVSHAEMPLRVVGPCLESEASAVLGTAPMAVT